MRLGIRVHYGWRLAMLVDARFVLPKGSIDPNAECTGPVLQQRVLPVICQYTAWLQMSIRSDLNAIRSNVD